MKLRFLGGQLQGRVVAVSGDSFRIGRGQRNDLVLNQDGVSRYHCQITSANGEWFIEDLDSTNGVRLNGSKIDDKQPIRPGDRIGISSNLLLFLAQDAAEEGGSRPVALQELDDSRPAAALAQAGDAQPTAGAVPGWNGAVDEPVEEEGADFPWFRLALLCIGLLVLLALGIDCLQRRSPVARQAAAAGPADAQNKTTEEPALWTELPADSEREATDRETAADQAGAVTPEEPGPENLPAEAPVETNSEEKSEAAAAWQALIRSIPEGATVFIDDEPAGSTPALVELEAGRHRLKLKKNGYEEVERLIDDKVLYPQNPFRLPLAAGTLRVTSAPPGASLIYARQLLGSTPLLLESLPPGDHTFTLVKYGYEKKEVTGRVKDGQGSELTVELTPRLAQLQVVTVPAGCEVKLDGLLKGVTQSEDGKNRPSRPLLVPGLMRGLHRLSVSHPLAGERAGELAVQNGSDVLKRVQFWVPDHLVILKNGRQIYGMRLSGEGETPVELLDRSFKRRRITADSLERLRELRPEEVRSVLGSRANEPMRLEPNAAGGEDDGAQQAELLPEPAFRLSAKQLEQEMRRNPLTEIRDNFVGEGIRLRGIPSRVITAEHISHVWLGPQIHCQLDAGSLPLIEAARREGKALSLQGTVQHCSAEEMVITRCRVVPGSR